ncbi:MAG: hypothetical protein A2V77_04565 [Anaeromyxobacter sp. RBG_16_69_14]|nr:MAG: hypothetical protein A2V77_04565 [Anaeromyxobacter sp. RBG_16_69_14]
MKPAPVALLATLLLAVSTAGCGSVKVRPSGSALRSEPKPKGCSIEFLGKAPDRAYEEVADLQAHVTSPPAGGADEVLREKACELGADAVVVTRKFVTNAYGHMLVAGTAIKYVEDAQPAPPEEPPEGEQVPGTVNL